MTTGPGLLTSSALAHVPHAFTTRRGGVSAGVFSSLNFGNPMHLPPGEKDPVSNIRANFGLVLRALGVPGRRVDQVYQVHAGAAHVFRPGAPSRNATPEGELDFRADALVTDDPSRMLCVRVADCAPVLLADEPGRIVAAVHAGWRGVVAGVVREGVRRMRELGAGPIAAAVGPCIGPGAFEVGPEVVEAMHATLAARAPVLPHPDAAAREQGKAMLDLAGAIHAQLEDAGVERVDVIRRCTVAEPDEFFSHRRDAGVTGRMGAFIGPRA